MLFRLFLALLILLPSYASAIDVPANKDQCLALCDQYFPGGGGTTPPPVTPPPSGVKVFPWPITFERDSDQGNGSAAILFRTLQDSFVEAVTVNSEVARKGRSYKGAPVFLLTKSGDKYSRPLKFFIRTSDGQVYTATSGSSGGGGGTPTGSYKNKAVYKAYGKRNGGRWAWRITKRGDSLGPGPVKFTFSPSGKTFTVKSTARNCRDREDTCQRDGRAPMNGFLFKPGNGVPNGEGDSDIGTAHKGIYLHAIYGDDSPTVTMEW